MFLLINNQHMKELAYKLIGKSSKKQLAIDLGITVVTLNTRLNKENWKKGEIQLLISLDK